MRLLACTLALALASLGRAAEPAATVDALAWLAGTWKCEHNGRTVTLHWSEPVAREMIGSTQTREAGSATAYGAVFSIRIGPDRCVEFIGTALGSSKAKFKLTHSTPREAVFENPAHDFPQRISYTLRDDGTLLAAIEGAKNGKTRRVEFPYRRAE